MLASVTIGSTIFGIVGVFLAVPFTEALATTARYLSEQLDEQAGPEAASRLES